MRFYVFKRSFINAILFWYVIIFFQILANNKISLGKVAENSLLWSKTELHITYFRLTPLC